MNHIYKQDMAIKAAKDRAAKARGEKRHPITPVCARLAVLVS
jgi:hypothetical protein